MRTLPQEHYPKMCLCFKVRCFSAHTAEEKLVTQPNKELLYFVRWGVKKEEGLVHTRAHTICFTRSQVFTHRLQTEKNISSSQNSSAQDFCVLCKSAFRSSE